MPNDGQGPDDQEQTSTGNQGTGSQQGTSQAASGQVFSADYVQSLRQEAAGYRVSARDWEQKHKDLSTQAQTLQTQIQDLTGKLDAATQALQAERLDRDAMGVAKELGISDTEAAIKLLDKSQIKYEDGKPTNLKELLQAVGQKHPFILGGGSSTTNPGRQGALTVDQIKRMPPQWINEHWDEVQAVLAGGK